MASSVVTSAVQWIGSTLIQEAGMLYGIEDQVQSLQEELYFMQQFLQDADAKQEVGEIGTLIRQTRKLAYDAEDVIDSYILEVQAKVGRQGHEGRPRLLIRLSRYWLYVLNAPSVYRVGKQIQAIQFNLKRVTQRLNNYGVRNVDLGNGRVRKPKPRSYPYDDNDTNYVVGLEEDTRKLIKLLMDEGNNLVNVVSVVGMGGSGKTTLAKKLYNHSYIKESFDCMAWVFISQEWSTQQVLLEILRKVSGHKETTQLLGGGTWSVEELVDKLHNNLGNKSYLIVLDDVWRREALEEILPALPRGRIHRRSKIIITTRNQEIIQIPLLQHNQCIHELQPLNDDEAWSLFSNLALRHLTNCNLKSFEDLGRTMLRKCEGLPLAIVALSGILNSKSNIREWQQVNEAVKSRLMEGRGSPFYGRVGELLALSYDDLPYYLKPCFLYLGVFPEDYRIPTGMLMRMWIAEGLFTANNMLSLEDIAMQCLEELSHRFMVQVAKTNFKGEMKAVRLHDLLRDLCVSKATEQNFLRTYAANDEPVNCDTDALADQPRRAALHSCYAFPMQASHLRSLVLLARSRAVPSDYVYKDTLDLRAVHKSFGLLRVLNLWGIKTPGGTLPIRIGSLIHLRYLGIRATNIIELPRSIGELRNLLTLDYRNVELDSNNISLKIPDVLGKLVRLRHLFLPMDCPWSVENMKLRSMTNLQTLWGVKQEQGGQWLSRELVKLSSTVKKLKTVVSGEDELKAAFSCLSLKSDSIHTFHCELRDGTTVQNVATLSHHQHLHKLILIGKVQMKLSFLLPSNVMILELKDSMLTDEDPMIALGALAHLKLLKLSNPYLGTKCACEPGFFPQLEELHLYNFRNLKTWNIEKGAMPCLKRLDIISCQKLEDFPRGLVYVTTLQQLELFRVSREFLQKAAEYGWSERHRNRMPHNFEAILEHCDSPIDMSSIRKLYKQLTSGVFLNQKKEKFWVVKQDDHYYNCFTLYADNICLSTQVDIDLLPVWNTEKLSWDFVETVERDGIIKVARLRSPTDVLALSLDFSIENLSPCVSYTMSFVIKCAWKGLEGGFQSVLMLPDCRPETHRITFKGEPYEWMKVSVGEFQIPHNKKGIASFCLHCSSVVGFEIKYAIIEPSASASKNWLPHLFSLSKFII